MSWLKPKSMTRGDVKAAVKRLRAQPGRSLSTMLGVVLAVTAVIVILGVGAGIKQQVQNQVDRLGKNLIMVRPGGNSSGLSSNINTLAGFGTTASLGPDDAQAITGISGIQTVVPLSLVDGKVMSDDGNRSFSGSVVATGTGFADVLHQGVDFGSFLSDDGDPNRAIIGENVAAQIFGEAVPLGRTFTFHGETFFVGGVMHEFENNPLLGDTDFNNVIFINYGVAKTFSSAPIYEILAQIKDGADLNQTAAAINRKLLVVHGGSNNFSVLKQNQSLDATNSILNLLTRFIVGAAAVTMLIGGVGIMNIMLVSVAERTHEIGIRKAIGATSQQILAQFMIEAIVLSLAGALLGAALAGGLILLIRLFSDWQPAMPWISAGITVLVAVIVGTIFGSIPALKAARKDPIDALRGE